MRASHADRQRTVEELRRHCASGRIDVDEYASRLERAMAATTLEELDELRADLPMMRIADPVGLREPARPALAGGRTGGGGPGIGQRVAALAVVAVAAVVLLGVLALSLAAEWTWAALLLIGWAAGVLQGRLGRGGRRP